MLQVDAAVLKRAKVMVPHTFLIRKKLLMINSSLNSISYSGKPILEHHPLELSPLPPLPVQELGQPDSAKGGHLFNDRCLSQKSEAKSCLQSLLLREF